MTSLLTIGRERMFAISRAAALTLGVVAFLSTPTPSARATVGPHRQEPTSPTAPSGHRRQPRAVLALYDGSQVGDIRETSLHRLAEMPLNHLGFVLRYHDIDAGLPTARDLEGVKGVLTWFSTDGMRRPADYLKWACDAIDAGLPFVVLGNVGAAFDENGVSTALPALQAFFDHLGLDYEGRWTTTTYAAHYVTQDRAMVAFERPLPTLVPAFSRVVTRPGDAVSYLSAQLGDDPGTRSDLVTVGRHGAYVAPGYVYYGSRTNNREFRQWLLNPFEFFRLALGTDGEPKLDTSTLSGRRIYYSHIDGDGWRNLTQIEPYKTRFVVSSRVVLEELVRPFPDLPVSIGAIAGDLDPAWHGTRESLTVAREIYALPHVEAAIHTYSHPLDWQFYAHATDEDEANYHVGEDGVVAEGDVVAAQGKHAKPRSYTTEPFRIEKEIDGAARYIDGILPPGKHVTVVQWSGNTTPFEAAVAQARRAGLANINGGDTRFDREFPSYAWVAPLGRRVGAELQVYSSNSNENTYTDLWRDRFFGFSFLSRTVRNTGLPRRVKPFNLYYHMYSGERLSSLNAVLANLQFARSLELAPVSTSLYARIVEGFFDASIEPLGPRTWRVHDRRALQTVRFDRASLEGVDFERSRGVVGQRHQLGSLYVALDEREPTPVVALKDIVPGRAHPVEPVPYLVEARWRVYGLRADRHAATFAVAGFGAGDMTWQWPTAETVTIRWETPDGAAGETSASVDRDGSLLLQLPAVAAGGALVRISSAAVGSPPTAQGGGA
ncbi:MAG: hypothetical protein U0Q12_21275 [Vicinamibacterales bacterium]